MNVAGKRSRKEGVAESPSLPLLSGMTLAVVVVSLLFGGGTRQGLWSDAIVQLISLPLLGLALKELTARMISRLARFALGLVLVLLLLPILQLVPLPPAIWSHLPGRSPFVAAYDATGMALPWSALSLDPAATWRSLLSLIPAMAVFLAALCLDLRTRRIISVVVLFFAVFSALLGLAQIAGGANSPWRFYEPTNLTDSVGFFANRNHYAALLYAGIPLAAAWGFDLLLGERRNRAFGLTLVLLAYLFIVLGLGMAHSRAGVMLALAAGVLSIPVGLGIKAARGARLRRRKALIAGAAVNLIGLLLAFQFGFVGLVGRFDNDSVLEDLRWPMAAVSWRATKANLPFGVGFGAFEPSYQMFETPAVVVEPYVNHAHDDWLELALDGGIPAVAALLAFLIWYAAASFAVWRRSATETRPIDAALPRAGSIIVGALLIHSALDYPLRTTTLMVVFAFACSLMIAPLSRTKRMRTAAACRRVALVTEETPRELAGDRTG